MAEVYDLKSGHQITSETRRPRGNHERDDHVLVRLGKKPVLKRAYGFLTALAFQSSVMLTWETIVSVLTISLQNGGLAGSIWEYVFVWVGSLAAFSTVAEIASMAPTAAGQYHWVAMLAPRSCRVFLSYIIGWLVFIGWQASSAASGFLQAQLIEGLVILCNPDFEFAPWQTMLLYWATIASCIFVNTGSSRLIPALEASAMVLHIVGFIAILVPLLYFGPHGDPTEVFTSFSNGGMWSTQGLSFMVGLTGPIYSILGVDSGVHMSEEIENPQKHVPRAIVWGVVLNGSLGFGMLIAMMFTLGDLDTILDTPTGEPFMAIYQQAVGSVAGATVMSAIVVIMNWVSAMSIVASTSRMTWSFARDRGIPGWRYLSSVEPRTTLPIWSITLTGIISVLLSLIVLGSDVAFNDVVSMTVSGAYASHFTVNGLLLWRRVTGQIQPFSHSRGTLMNVPDGELMWGPWRIPEPWGTIINAFGCLYLLAAHIFTYFPTVSEPDPSEMNYSSLMVGVVVIFACVYYLVYGRKSYSGPIIEVVPTPDTSTDKS